MVKDSYQKNHDGFPQQAHKHDRLSAPASSFCPIDNEMAPRFSVYCLGIAIKHGDMHFGVMILIQNAVVAVATASIVNEIRAQKAEPGDVSVYPLQAPRLPPVSPDSM